MKSKPEVGQKLYSLNVGNAARNCDQVLTEVIVQKVGRKYFTTRDKDKGEYSDTQYFIDGWREKTNYSVNSVLYSDPQEWLDKKEYRILFEGIGRYFDTFNRPKELTLAQLREISNIISHI